MLCSQMVEKCIELTKPRENGAVSAAGFNPVEQTIGSCLSAD